MENSTRAHVCAFIDKWLTDHHISNNECAEYLGVMYSSVRRWRTGVCAPDLDLFPKICDYMHVSINEFLNIYNNGLSEEENKVLTTYETNKQFKDTVDLIQKDDKFNEIVSLIGEYAKK